MAASPRVFIGGDELRTYRVWFCDGALAERSDPFDYASAELSHAPPALMLLHVVSATEVAEIACASLPAL